MFWNDRIEQEKINLTSPDYDHQQNDLAALIVILNEWVKAGESPLLVGHQGLCQFLRSHQLAILLLAIIRDTAVFFS